MKKCNQFQVNQYKKIAFISSLLFASTATAADFTGNLKEVTITDALKSNLPPVAQISTSVSGSTVTFDASGTTDPDGSIKEYKWDFGDGSTSTEATATHQFSTNDATVTLTVTDNGGGVAIKQVNLALFTETFDVIVDNAETEGFATVGTWGSSTYFKDYYGTNYRYSAKGDGSSRAVWTVNIPTTGNYTLYSYKSSADSSRSSKAPFTLMNNTTSLGTVLVNQQVGSGVFFSLGTYSLQKGVLTVTLSSATDGYVIADAVKLTYNP